MRNCGGMTGLLLTQYDAGSASEPIFQLYREAPATGRNAYWPRSLQFSFAMFVQAGWHVHCNQGVVNWLSAAVRHRDRAALLGLTAGQDPLPDLLSKLSPWLEPGALHPA
jgi:hypothetical protein